MCRRLRRGDIVHNATSYLISSSSSASIAVEIAARCLPWAQRRQLLIYRDRTTEPLTPASTRSIPIAIVILSASHGPLCISLPIDLSPRHSPSNSLRNGFIVVTVASDAFCPRDSKRFPEWVYRHLRNRTRLCVRLHICSHARDCVRKLILPTGREAISRKQRRICFVLIHDKIAAITRERKLILRSLSIKRSPFFIYVYVYTF